MSNSNISIDGKDIKNPSSFKIERYNITTSSRTAAGLMMMDLIAKKRKFYFTYEAISASDLDNILQAIWDSDNIFFELSYMDGGTSKSATVYVGSIPSELHRGGEGSDWVWKNVSFNLVEQ